MNKYTFKLLASIPVANILGEGIIWNKSDGAIWWVDIQSSVLHRYHLASQNLKVFELPHRLAAFGFVQGSDNSRIVAAFDRGLAIYELESGGLQWLAEPEQGSPGNRFNDGRVDFQGRFWAGTMIEDRAASLSSPSLYRLDHESGQQKVVGGLKISNGLCWSPDSSRMYHSDSPRNEIYVYDFDAATGQLGQRRIFARTQAGHYPDGAITDNEGFLLSAQWGGSQINRYHPNGELDGVLEVPVTQPTCMTFAGEGLDLLCITTAKEGLSTEELERQGEAGNVLIYQTTFTGLASPEYIQF